jgi:SAM-dependent methyltransferase
MTDPDDETLAAYEMAAQRYIDNSLWPAPTTLQYLDRLADMVDAGRVLEIGSGPGWDATYLESRGVHVIRTDAALAFVEMLRATGHDAYQLDVRIDDLGGPYDAVLANAVLLHLSAEQFEDVLLRAHRAVVPSGVLAFTLKDGDGAGWSSEKLGVPRHFRYWREPALREVLARTGWTVVLLEHVVGRTEPWLYVFVRKAP